MNTDSIAYGEHQICFDVRVSRKKDKKGFTIQVTPEGSVRVSTPKGASKRQMREVVRKKAQWILKHVEHSKQRHKHLPPREYVSGETHFYLGKRYVLKVHNVSNKTPSVKLIRGHLEVKSPYTDSLFVKSLLNQWYEQRSLEYILKRLEFHVARTPWVPDVPQWSIKPMKRQWGSCSSRGTLSLNLHLIKAPKDCIDYVLCHELCHLKEHNHSDRFYRLLDSLLPNWKTVKKQLDGMAAALLNE